MTLTEAKDKLIAWGDQLETLDRTNLDKFDMDAIFRYQSTFIKLFDSLEAKQRLYATTPAYKRPD